MKHTIAVIFLFVLISFLPPSSWAQQKNSTPFNYTINKRVNASKGVVVSAHPLASQAGLLILQKGGNAVDAAIATQLALAVVYPGAGNLGGGGFMVAHLANKKNIALDYRETAPAAASKDMYLDSAGNVQTNLSLDGHLAAGVPGTVAGLFTSMKYAKLPFSTLIESAIRLAERGFAITSSQAKSFNSTKEDFVKFNTSKPAFVKEQHWNEGDTLIQIDLANTLKRIRDLGQKGFYEGETARLIVAEMQKGGGIISYDDLKNYKAKERTAIVFPYKNTTVVTMPLPSSGGIIIQQMLGMIEHRDLTAMKFQTTAAVQLMTEVERRAFADRAEFLGDEDFVKVPVKTLVSKAYLDERMKSFSASRAGKSDSIKGGIIPKESLQTTHLSVIDNNGNAVSVTTTLNNSYGSKTLVSGAGFLLNDEMDDFSVKPGVPNMYGAVGNEANAIAPGKRMLSSMTPTIVLKDDQPFVVAGTPGGTTIPTSVFQTIVNIVDFGLSTDDAVNKPKFHHQWLPDELYIETGFPENVAKELEAMGYKLKHIAAIGRTEVIKVSPAKAGKPKFEGVADNRGDDDAEGW
ncbi:MAG: gamma-glutamyltransferase [Ginsengibacter sp.]